VAMSDCVLKMLVANTCQVTSGKTIHLNLDRPLAANQWLCWTIPSSRASNWGPRTGLVLLGRVPYRQPDREKEAALAAVSGSSAVAVPASDSHLGPSPAKPVTH
jgi:hypothetical protein